MHSPDREGLSFCKARPHSAAFCRSSAGGISDALLSGMKDLVLIAAAVGFFAVAWLYVRSFDRL